jgi:hypothetical protein
LEPVAGSSFGHTFAVLSDREVTGVLKMCLSYRPGFSMKLFVAYSIGVPGDDRFQNRPVAWDLLEERSQVSHTGENERDMLIFQNVFQAFPDAVKISCEIDDVDADTIPMKPPGRWATDWQRIV